MAKQAAAAPVSTVSESRESIVQVPTQSGGPPLVVNWNNEAQDAGMDTVGAAQLTHDPNTGKAKPTPADALPEARGTTVERGDDGKFKKSAAELAVHGEDGAPDPETPATPEPETPKAAPSSAEKRANALAALATERKTRELETALKTEQEGRKADREARERHEGLFKTGTLGDLLAARGMTADDALEALLKGGDAIKPSAAAPKAETPEARELAALKAKLAELDAWKAAQAERESSQQMQAAISHIADVTKEMDIPVTRAVDGGMELVLRTAHELWQAAGGKGPMADHIPEAAELAEGHWREQKPALAKLADAAKANGAGKAKPAADPAKALAAKSIGRRTGANPDAKPSSLWQRGADGQPPTREDVDAQIKREFGFVDGAG